MSIATPHEPSQGSTAEPAWEVARLFPNQGAWSVDDYMDLTNSTNQRVELSDGNIEVLAMPTEAHELIVRFLFLALYNFATPSKLGETFFSGIRVRTSDSNHRMPDIVFMRAKNGAKRTNDFWIGADLVIEVVSPDAKSRKRDLVTKRAEYAAVGIPEYWIADPENRSITVLKIMDAVYVEHGVFKAGQTATSPSLEGFNVPVDDVFSAADR